MLTSKDVAKALNVSEQTVRHYARDGLIPFVQTPGGHRRFDLDDVKVALRLARPRRFAPIDREGIRLTDEPHPTPILRAETSPGRAPLDAAPGATSAAPIAFLGVRGSSRFISRRTARA
ncbi:MAG: helix-turn-helix domain-containing protein [Actinomycetota bacterium]